MPLKGLLFDADGSPMTPSFTHAARGQVYRYYVSAPLLQGAKRDPEDDAVRRAPAQTIEDLVRHVLVRLSGTDDPSIGALARVEIHPTTVQLVLRRSVCVRRATDPASEMRSIEARLQAGRRIAPVDDDHTLVRMIVPCRMKRSCGRIRITDAAGKPLSQTPQPDDTLISAVRGAHAVLSKAAEAAMGFPEQAMLDVAPPNPYVRNLVRLAFLAPHIQALILEGRQPMGLNRQRLILGKIPLAWADQRRVFETG